MKYTNRVISGLLSLAMVGSLCTTWLPSAAAVSTQEDSAESVSQTTGSIALTIRFGLPQTAAGVAQRGIKLQLTDGSQNTATIDLETKEVSRIEDFVIAVDTSMSCSGDLVRRFLEETCAVLEESESYFKKVNIRILQCDDQVRSDVRIENRQQLQDYMEHFVIRGMGGTDFRPVFEHVAALTRQGAFTKLKGLLYFTDGKGIYPLKKPPYDTAFVFLKDQYEDESVPPWAIKLVLDAEDMEQIADRREEPHEY